MTSYQDVVRANLPLASWAFSEASGTTFAPWIGSLSLTGSGTLLYRQTGPFAASFALHLAAAATLRSPALSTGLTGALYYEVWFKLDSLTLANSQFVYFVGNANTNGYGVYIHQTTKHVFIFSPGAGAGGPIDTGYTWPDTSWHLVAQGGSGTASVLAVDGVIVWQGNAGNVLTPNPNQIGWACDSSGGSNTPVSLAYPVVYLHPITASPVYADYLASTDPDAALAYTPGGQSEILNLILASVRRTYT